MSPEMPLSVVVGSLWSEADELGNLWADEIVIPSGGEVRVLREKKYPGHESGRNGGLYHPVWIG